MIVDEAVIRKLEGRVERMASEARHSATKFETLLRKLEQTELQSFELRRDYEKLARAFGFGPQRPSRTEVASELDLRELLREGPEGAQLRESSRAQEVDRLKSTVENIKNLLQICPEQPKATLNAICSVVFRNDASPSSRASSPASRASNLPAEEKTQLARLDGLIGRLSRSLTALPPKQESEETESSLRSLNPSILSDSKLSSGESTSTSQAPKQNFTMIEKAFMRNLSLNKMMTILQ